MLWGNTSKIIIGLRKNTSSFSLAGGLGSHMSRLTTACNNLIQVDSERLNGRWSGRRGARTFRWRLLTSGRDAEGRQEVQGVY